MNRVNCGSADACRGQCATTNIFLHCFDMWEDICKATSAWAAVIRCLVVMWTMRRIIQATKDAVAQRLPAGRWSRRFGWNIFSPMCFKQERLKQTQKHKKRKGNEKTEQIDQSGNHRWRCGSFLTPGLSPLWCNLSQRLVSLLLLSDAECEISGLFVPFICPHNRL